MEKDLKYVKTLENVVGTIAIFVLVPLFHLVRNEFDYFSPHQIFAPPSTSIIFVVFVVDFVVDRHSDPSITYIFSSAAIVSKLFSFVVFTMKILHKKLGGWVKFWESLIPLYICSYLLLK